MFTNLHAAMQQTSWGSSGHDRYISVLETNGIRQPARHLAQIISLTFMQLRSHFKVAMEFFRSACLSGPASSQLASCNWSLL